MQGPWSPLKIRAFRALWLAGLVSNIGTFMHIAAAAWTMTTLTDSATLVGLVQTAWAIPGFLLALYAGAFADMVDRRRLISVTSLFALIVAALLAFLQWSGGLTIELLILGTFFESVALTLSAPAFMALTPELVDEPRLPPAIGLDAVSRNIAQSVGPAIAGIIIAAINPGAVFALNAASFVGIVAVAQRRGSAARPIVHRQSLKQAINNGIKHVVGTKQLRNLASRLAIMLGVTSVLTSVLPLFAKQNLQVASNGFGVLSGALGVGSVGAVWVLPRIRTKFGIETITLVAAAIWSLSVALLSATSAMVVAVVALLICGACTMAMLNILFSTFMVQLPNELRGRGSSLAMLMVWFGIALGTFIWGAVATTIGVGQVLLVAAVVNCLAAVFNCLTLRVAPNAFRRISN